MTEKDFITIQIEKWTELRNTKEDPHYRKVVDGFISNLKKIKKRMEEKRLEEAKKNYISKLIK